MGPREAILLHHGTRHVAKARQSHQEAMRVAVVAALEFARVDSGWGLSVSRSLGLSVSRRACSARSDLAADSRRRPAAAIRMWRTSSPG